VVFAGALLALACKDHPPIRATSPPRTSGSCGWGRKWATRSGPASAPTRFRSSTSSAGKHAARRLARPRCARLPADRRGSRTPLALIGDRGAASTGTQLDGRPTAQVVVNDSAKHRVARRAHHARGLHVFEAASKKRAALRPR